MAIDKLLIISKLKKDIHTSEKKLEQLSPLDNGLTDICCDIAREEGRLETLKKNLDLFEHCDDTDFNSTKLVGNDKKIYEHTQKYNRAELQLTDFSIETKRHDDDFYQFYVNIAMLELSKFFIWDDLIRIYAHLEQIIEDKYRRNAGDS